MNRIRWLWVVFLLHGCAGVGVTTDGAGAGKDDLTWLLDGSAYSEALAANPGLPDENIMGLTPEMEAFVARVIPANGTDRAKLTALLQSMIGPTGLAVRYDTDATFTAEGVFKNHSANCLSFTLLAVAMLRHVGLTAHFNEVDTPPIWDMSGDYTLEMYRHINLISELAPDKRFVVDLSMEEYDTSYEQRIISDEHAMAQYYNNRAMELFKAGSYEDALRHEFKAIRLGPRLAYLWNNLGSIYRRAGKGAAAEAAFRHSLSLAPEDLVATSNLARFYRETGDVERAGALEARAERFRNRNPYYQYRLALDAFLASDYRSARDRAEHAIELYGREHRFHFLLGAAQEMLGDHRQAEISMKRALSLTTDAGQAARYRSKWDRLVADSSHG